MLIKFLPIPVNKIWGGDNLRDFYNISGNAKIGEIWGISGHKSKSNSIVNKDFIGKNFRDIYKNNRDYFGNLDFDEFPLIFKIIDAEKNLSIQVHPNNQYALKHENANGKDECWYVLKTKSKLTEIIIGHNAKTKKEFENLVKEKRFDKLLNHYTIKHGDFFYIPSGTVHAICADTTLLEISLSSDVTYRLYDYDRLENGVPRELHIDKALDVIKIPDNKIITTLPKKIFSFEVKENRGKNETISHIYGDYLYVLKGFGLIDGIEVKQGDFLMITSRSCYHIDGDFSYTLTNILLENI